MLERLPTEIRCQIFEYVFCNDSVALPIRWGNSPRCICSVSAKNRRSSRKKLAGRLAYYVKLWKPGVWNNRARIRSGTNEHTPCTRSLDVDCLFVSRDLYGDARASMLRVKMVWLTSMETLRFFARPGLADLIRNLTIYERHSDESIFHAPRESFMPRHTLVAHILQRPKLQTLTIDLDPLLPQHQRGEFVSYNFRTFLAVLGMPEAVAHCHEIGRYSFEPGQGLDKLILVHNDLATLWASVSQRVSSAESFDATWLGINNLSLLHSRVCPLPTVSTCVRVQQASCLILEAIRNDLSELSMIKSTDRIKSWLWWLGREDMVNVDCRSIMPGHDVRLNSAWTELLVGRLIETKLWMVTRGV